MIRLRAVKERTLQQVMIDAVGSEAAYDELLTKSHGNRCLVILEGLDEISAHWQQNDTTFCQLAKTTTFLSHANVLVTSRPHACIDLHRDIKDYTRTIEIVGFDKPQIKEYAESYFHNSNTAEMFMLQINNDPHISSLCYVPLCLNMVLEYFKYNNETLHTTLTELYQSFIISKVDEHFHFKKAVSLGIVLETDQQCIKNLATVLSDVPNVPSKGALETMFLLSKLAYKSYFEWYNKTERNPKIIYTKKDLAHCNITNSESDACGLLKATNTLFATGNTAVYTFNHLSVQEYFCALYISLLPEDQQLQLLKDNITDYPHMWPFYAGITKLQSSIVLQYVQVLLLQSKPLESIISYKVIRPNENYKIKIFIVLNSIYEAQLLSNFCKHEVKSLNLSGRTLRPYDCMSISYFMSIVPITHLFLIVCSIGDHEAEMLARWKDLKPSLKVLDLSMNHITHKGLEGVVTIIKSCHNLTHFSISKNPIGDDGIRLFSLLKSAHLVHLNIGITNMTEVGTYALSEYFNLDKFLQSLDVSNNNIKDIGLTRILCSFPSTLVRLIATKCCLTCAGAVNISEVLRINKTLKYLDISKNAIGDDGISAISDSLHVNTTLIQLVACYCKFYGKGTESVGIMLRKNAKVKYLDISENHIGDDGISAISDGLHVNTTLIQLVACYCKFYGKGAESVGIMLRKNAKVKYLDISENPIGDDGISAISDGLHVNTMLIQLVAHNCEFRSKGAESVAKMLQTNKTLKYLDISSNHIEDDGITAVTCSIENNITLTELKLHDCKFHSKGLQNINKMMMINKSLIKLSVNDGDDDEDDGEALTTVLETYLKSNCKLSQLSISGRIHKIEHCISKAKDIMTCTRCTEHYSYGIIKGRMQSLTTLKV